MIAGDEIERLRHEAMTLAKSAKLELLIGAARREVTQLRRALAELRLQLRLRAFARSISARAYNPEQPRVPAGNPTGGQWTLEGGMSLAPTIDAAESEEVRVAGVGHHYVPTAVYNKYPFPPETQKIFDQARTGHLYSHRHNYGDGHSEYSEAVRRQLDDYMKSRGITPQQMTPDHARSFTQQILHSRDPLIRDFNRRIWLREIRYWILRAPRGE